MKSEPAVRKIKLLCMLRSTVVGTRVRRSDDASLRDVLDQAPKEADPVTVTISDAMRLSGLSRATINRLISAGRTDGIAA